MANQSKTTTSYTNQTKNDNLHQLTWDEATDAWEDVDESWEDYVKDNWSNQSKN